MQKISDFFQTRLCLNLFIIIIFIWMLTSGLSKDPYPYQFASTITNFLGFLLMIIVNIAVKDQTIKHDEHLKYHSEIDDAKEKLK